MRPAGRSLILLPVPEVSAGAGIHVLAPEAAGSKPLFPVAGNDVAVDSFAAVPAHLHSGDQDHGS